MRKRLNNIFFAVGVVAVVIMFFTFDVSLGQLWACIERAGYWIVAVLGLWTMLYVMNAWAWRFIIKGSGKCDVGFVRLCKLTVSGFALSYAAPFSLVGGEAYKIMELSRHVGVQRATSSVILFTMMHVFSHFWFWLTGVVLYVLMVVVYGLPMNVGIAVVLSLVILFCYGGIYLFLKGYKNGMVVKLLRFVCKIPGLRGWCGRFMEEHRTDLERIDCQIAELHSQNKVSFMCSFFLEYFGRVLQCFEIFFMLLLLDIDYGGGVEGYLLTFLYSFLILAFTSLFANLIGFIPFQLGGREGGFAMSVVQLGMNDGIGLFISIITRVRELFWTFIGLVLMKIGRSE